MPRSGSTLLQNILGNNPKIYTTPTSPLFEYINSVREVYTKTPLVKSQDEQEMLNAYTSLLRYALHGFFYGITDKPYVVDKSRGWAVNMEFLNKFYPGAKMVCMVRDLRDIITSMEKNYRKHPEMKTAPLTTAERVAIWLSADSKPVGNTLKNLHEVFHRKMDEKIIFIRFEDLTKDPQKMIDIVHDFLGIERHKYDFNNILQVTYENDKFHGIYGDHIIKNKVTPVKSMAKELLGEPICNQIYERHKWYFERFNYKK
jgi:sulfotransferase